MKKHMASKEDTRCWLLGVEILEMVARESLTEKNQIFW